MNRLNLIALAVFTGLLVWVFTFDSPKTRLIQTRVNAAFASFKRSGAEVQGALSGNADVQKSPAQLLSENERLTIENAELRVYKSRVDQLQSEVSRLDYLLGFVKRQDTALLLVGHVTKEGVLDGSPIVIPTGTDGRPALVGRVARADANEAEILFITDELCKVAARIEGSGERGLLEGMRVSAARRPELRLRYLPRNAAIKQGQKVLSHDSTNRFPPDILLGTVIDFRDGDASSEAIVEPAVNLDDLPYVLVMQLVPEETHAPPAAAPK